MVKAEDKNRGYELKKDSAWVVVLPIIVWAAMSFGFNLFLGDLGQFTVIKDYGQIHDVLIEEVAGRVLWFAAVLAIVFTTFVSGTVLVIRTRRYKDIYKSLIFITILTSCAALVVWGGMSMDPAFMSFGKDVYAHTIAQQMGPILFSIELETFVRIVNSFGYLGAAFVAVGIVAVLGRFDNGSIKDLSDQFNDVRAFVFVGALVLVTGMVSTTVFYLWGDAVVHPDQVESYRKLTKTITTYYGVGHALMLAVAFIVPFMVLKKRAVEWVVSNKKYTTEEERQECLRAHGFVLDLGHQKGNLLAIMSPFLAAPVTQLLSMLPTG